MVGETHDDARFAERVYGAANMLAAPAIGRGDKAATVLANRRELVERNRAAGSLGAFNVPLPGPRSWRR